MAKIQPTHTHAHKHTHIHRKRCILHHEHFDSVLAFGIVYIATQCNLPVDTKTCESKRLLGDICSLQKERQSWKTWKWTHATSLAWLQSTDDHHRELKGLASNRLPFNSPARAASKFQILTPDITKQYNPKLIRFRKDPKISEEPWVLDCLLAWSWNRVHTHKEPTPTDSCFTANQEMDSRFLLKSVQSTASVNLEVFQC